MKLFEDMFKRISCEISMHVYLNVSSIGETAGRLLTPMTLHTVVCLFFFFSFSIYRVFRANCIYVPNVDILDCEILNLFYKRNFCI